METAGYPFEGSRSKKVKGKGKGKVRVRAFCRLFAFSFPFCLASRLRHRLRIANAGKGVRLGRGTQSTGRARCGPLFRLFLKPSRHEYRSVDAGANDDQSASVSAAGRQSGIGPAFRYVRSDATVTLTANDRMRSATSSACAQRRPPSSGNITEIVRNNTNHVHRV